MFTHTSGFAAQGAAVVSFGTDESPLTSAARNLPTRAARSTLSTNTRRAGIAYVRMMKPWTSSSTTLDIVIVPSEGQSPSAALMSSTVAFGYAL
jgi:hypothetical protein